VSKDEFCRGRAIALKASAKLPRILATAEVQAVLDACTRLRDRFFFAVLHETGCRTGGGAVDELFAIPEAFGVGPLKFLQSRPGPLDLGTRNRRRRSRRPCKTLPPDAQG
jgi:hypothetical protein